MDIQGPSFASASKPSTNSAIILKICQLECAFDSDHLRCFDILIVSFIHFFLFMVKIVNVIPSYCTKQDGIPMYVNARRSGLVYEERDFLPSLFFEIDQSPK